MGQEDINGKDGEKNMNELHGEGNVIKMYTFIHVAHKEKHV